MFPFKTKLQKKNKTTWIQLIKRRKSMEKIQSVRKMKAGENKQKQEEFDKINMQNKIL